MRTFLKTYFWDAMTAGKLLALAAISFVIVLGALELTHQRLAEGLETRSEDSLSGLIKSAVASPTSYDPEFLISLAEIASTTGTDRDALVLLYSALERNPQTPFGWTLAAFLETRMAGKVTPAAEFALNNSLELCRLCDEALIKWRLEFAISFWSDLPYQTRIAIFEGADLLRWWHLDYAFLEQITLTAQLNGVPFRAYQGLIDTPVRPQEVGRRPNPVN